MFLIHKMLNMLFRYYSCLEVTEHKQHWLRGSGCGGNRVSCWLLVSVYTCLPADQKSAAAPVLLILFSLPQGGLHVLAMQSVFEESLPRPSVDAIRGEMLPSCWILQPVRRNEKEVTRVIYLLQVKYACQKYIRRLSCITPYFTGCKSNVFT